MKATPTSALWGAAALLAGCSGAVQSSSPAAPMPDSGAVAASRAASVGRRVRDLADSPAPANAKSAPEPSEATEVSAEAPADTRPRMGSIAHFSYIYRTPDATGLALGYIRMGTAVPLRSDKPVPSKTCSRGAYAVEPRGYACLDHTTTLDLQNPYYLALKSVSPANGVAWPYRYAFSNGAPMYSRVPTPEESEKETKKFGAAGSYVQLAEWSAGHEELLTKDAIVATDPVPDLFAGGKRLVGGGTRSPKNLLWRVIPNGSMVAYSKAFEAQGRVWLLTPDLMLVPADRVRQLRRSTFHGVKIGDGVELPLAWNRTKGLKYKQRRQSDGKIVPTEDAIAAKSFVMITDDPVREGGTSYFPLRGAPDTFVAADDVTVSRAKKTLPSTVLPGQKWIEAKILPGTLTAYEGDKPVLATLFSPGKGGVPVPGHDNEKYATTEMGYFPIQWKDHVATMTNEMGEPKLMWFTDVPHIQYLHPPLAMHVAFWHEDFGNPKSAECVNVSPEDGHFLFNWTDPGLPEGWGAIRPGSGNGRSTAVIITAR